MHAHQFGFLACLRSYQDLVDSSTLLTPNQPVIGGYVLAVVLVVLALTLWGLYQRWLRVTVPRSGDVRMKGETPKLEFVGGARVGANYTAPLAKLRIWAGGISISAPGAWTSIAWQDMTGASLIRPALVPVRFGVEFHAKGFRPVVYWGREDECRRILDVCEQNGVDVDRQAVRRL